MRRFFFICTILLAVLTATAQLRFNLSCDISPLRNFSPKQKFWALGQGVRGDFFVLPGDGFFAGVRYFTPGRFRNDFTATAKQPSTQPQIINYTVKGTWNLRQISLGWQHFFSGTYDREEGWGFYSTVGFGFLFAKAQNEYLTNIDTTLYQLPPRPQPGAGRFNRLTLDLGLGAEYPLGANFFLYGEAQTWLQMSSYPSPLLHSNKNVPLPLMFNGGIRILFGD